MRKTTLLAITLLAVLSLPLWARGEAEEILPPYDPAIDGWQAVSWKKGAGTIKLSESRRFQLLVKNAVKAEPNALKLWLKEFCAPVLGLYASSGADFSLKPKGASMTGAADQVFTRASIDRQEAFGDDQIVTFGIKSMDGKIPALPKSSGRLYAFRGYVTVNPQTAGEAQTQAEMIMAHAVQRLAQEAFPGENIVGKRGRVWLVEHRFVFANAERLGVYCKIAVEFY